jgi:hypothetical protein
VYPGINNEHRCSLSKSTISQSTNV